MVSFQRSLEQFAARGATVLGISIDSQFVQGAFAQHCGCTYPFLGDPNRDVSRAYGVLLPQELAGIRDVAERAVYVVGTDGAVRYAWSGNVTGMPDVAEVLAHV